MSATRYAICRMIEDEASDVLDELASTVLPLYKQHLAVTAHARATAGDEKDQRWLQRQEQDATNKPAVVEHMRRIVEIKHRQRWQPRTVDIYDTLVESWPQDLQAAVMEWATRHHLLLDGGIPEWFLVDIEFTLYMWQLGRRHDQFWCADIDLPKGPLTRMQVKADLHIQWFVRYQVCGWPVADIRKEYPKKFRPATSLVNDVINEVAKTAAFTRRPKNRAGRPPAKNPAVS